MLVSSYDVVDFLFCESLAISKAISYYGAQVFSLHSPKASLPLVTCSSPHRTSEKEDILHPLGHLILRLGDDFTTHGLLFKDAKYQFLECSTHGLNPQALFLSYQLILVALHGSNFHLTAVYILDSIEHILILPKRKIP